MSVVVTGSAGLVGSEAAAHYAAAGATVLGIDNDMRGRFFGAGASTAVNRVRLERRLGTAYRHVDLDIRDREGIERLFQQHGDAVTAVIHAAAQPSHDWAGEHPDVDFSVNALGTLNLLEATRLHAREAAFVFLSTNKVYGDAPNRLPLVELETRWEIEPDHEWADGIPEDMSVDQSLHSVFGASKLAADILVQEYGRYFGLRTACFRCGCLTGPRHTGAELHGFLSYLMKCAVTGTAYTVYGYEGKQVRDNLHSADLIAALDRYVRQPRRAEVYNLGGGRFSNVSLLEAIRLCEEIVGRRMSYRYSPEARRGDHIWWVSDNGKFREHYPGWELQYDVPTILREIYEENCERWLQRSA